MTRHKTFAKEMRQCGYSAAEDWARLGKPKPKEKPNPPIFDQDNLKYWLEGWERYWRENDGI